MNLPEIFSKSDAIHVEKINGTVVDYFIFPEFEIHRNRIPPHSTQEWHFHSKIEEVIVVTQGELVLSWMENGNVKRSIHTLSNETDFPCLFTVFRFVPDGVDKRELIKQDKTILKKN